MLIGHLPAGYLWTRTITRWGSKWASLERTDKLALMAMGLLSSVLPDGDMLYFYLVDNHQHLHHGYWTHLPLFWTALFVCPLGTLWIFWRRLWLIFAVIYSNLMLHMVLDTIVGKIRWLYPFSSRDFVLFEVMPRYKWAYGNFILHWTFLLEIAVVIWALVVFSRSHRPHQDLEGG